MIDKINKIKENKVFNTIMMFLKVISAFLIIVVVSIVFVQRVSDNKVTIGGIGIFTIVSESMSPEYEVWDMIISKEADPSSIKVGDDVVYLGKEGAFADKIVTHRVIEIKDSSGKRQFVTKGIANDIEDPAINEDQVYGKVLFKSSILSFLSKLINNLYGFYFIIFVPFVIMLFIEIIDIVNEKEELKRNRKK
ncbi:MAG: signal peptidase I [Bacilli bacterium]